MALCFLLLFVFLPFIVYCGYPISDPNASTVIINSMPYNLIDANPSCFSQGVCPMFPPGGRLSAFPNSEEKFQHILHNMHRMFPNQSLDIAEGKWKFGGNAAGGRTEYCQHSCDHCGTWHEDRRPLYWYSDANQMARFKQWDENECNQTWYDENGNSAHSTCKKGLSPVTSWGSGIQSITGTNRCALFGTIVNPSGIDPANPQPFNDDCEFGGRGSKFCHDDKDECEFHTEGICGGNSCFWDPHCEPIFANMYDYVGKGFVAGMNGVAAVYSRFTKEIDYLLPAAAHYDERIRMVAGDWEQNGKTFALMLEYFDSNKTQKVTDCYALYDDKFVSMNVYVSNSPNDRGKYKGNGYYDTNSFSVIFKENYTPPTQCMPYSFICKTTQNEFIRLPEDADYYFGTEWIDWKWSNYKNNQGLECKENHYYYDGNEWIVNGGPTLNRCDIWYYHDSDYSECIGCSKIAKLDCLSQCIYNGNENDCSCDHIQPISYGKQQCTTTAAPTLPSLSPTEHPTAATRSPTTVDGTYPPTLPSLSPTDRPSAMPTEVPTNRPTKKPTFKNESTPFPSISKPVTLFPSISSITLPDNNAKKAVIVVEPNESGGIVASVLLGLIFVFVIFLFVYWKHETKEAVNTETKMANAISHAGLPKFNEDNGTLRPPTPATPCAGNGTSLGEDDDDADEHTPLSSPNRKEVLKYPNTNENE